MESGDRVALVTPNKLPFLMGHLGVFLAGGVPLPLNPRFTREELRYFLSDSGAKHVIAGSDQQSLLSELPHQPRIFHDATCLEPPEHLWREPAHYIAICAKNRARFLKVFGRSRDSLRSQPELAIQPLKHPGQTGMWTGETPILR